MKSPTSARLTTMRIMPFRYNALASRLGYRGRGHQAEDQDGLAGCRGKDSIILVEGAKIIFQGKSPGGARDPIASPGVYLHLAVPAGRLPPAAGGGRALRGPSEIPDIELELGE
jgi:hypothetical protein